MELNMSNEKILISAFSTKECLFEVANKFSAISDSLHISLRGFANEKDVSTQKTYALITEEYGLRTRLAILRGDSENRLVHGVSTSHESFISLLSHTEVLIKSMKKIDEIAYLINSISVICICIFPGKAKILDFLISSLRDELDLMKK
jgi:hypothetical protein